MYTTTTTNAHRFKAISTLSSDMKIARSRFPVTLNDATPISFSLLQLDPIRRILRHFDHSYYVSV